MTKQILFSLLNCSWQWMLLIGLIWFVATPSFHKSRRSNTTVHLLWLLSLLSLPILFGLNQFVPAPSIGNAVPELAQAKPINVSGLAALATDLPEISSTENYTQSENQLFAGGKFFFNWETKTDLLLCVWAIGALAMFVRFMFGLYRIYQLRRSAMAADDSYQAICRRLARQLDINRPVTVCFSDRVSSPISFGWLSPYILIPRKLNLEQFELVAAHELAHVQRLDWLTNLFSHLVGVIFFFHPIYHFLNRELVRVRERICDDWVIRLTGARKNYAQCLLDLVRHEDRVIPLALSLNQPSQLESRIDSILKNNRRLDVQLKPRLQLMAATLLLTCLPLLAMAQLVPLKTFQVSLFAQTPQKVEKGVDETEKKQGMEKAKDGKMDGKQYKDKSHIEVKDPTLFEQSEENKIFSGPQPGEKLPPLTVTGIGGRIDGTTFDITTKADGKPLVLFLQDTNAVGIKGLVNVFGLLLQVDALQKRDSKATGTEKSNEGFQIGVVFLADNLDTLPEWARDMLRKEIPNEVLTGLSPDGREGPGNYGLNRNVAQTVLIAKDGKVLHNFAFTQPMLYSDPHFLGAIAQAIEVEPATLEKWLNEEGEWLVGDENTNPTSATVEKWLNEEPAEGTRMERGGEQMERGGARDRERTASREALVKRFDKDGDGKLNREEGMAARRAIAGRESQNRNRNDRVEVKNPAEFKKTQEKEIFSGPQPGEKLPSLQATGVYGEIEGKTFDFIAKADGRAQVLLLQDESRVGLRGLVSVAGVVDKISNRSDKDLHISVVFLSDDSDALKKIVIGIARRVPENVLVGMSPDGREGPGSYGLNRNVAQTVIIAKDGEVLHNFAFTQPMLYADPHVLGAIAQAIGEEPASVAKWLNEAPVEDARPERDRKQMEDKSNQTDELLKQFNTLHEMLERISETVSAAKTEGKEDRLDQLAELVEQLNTDLKILRRMQKSISAAKTEGKEDRLDQLAELVEQLNAELEELQRINKRASAAKRKNENRYSRGNVEVENPAEFKKTQGTAIFSGPQPGEKLPPLMAKGINGETEGKTFDVIAKADGQLLVLFLQDESGLGLRGLLGISRLLAQIAEKSKEKMHISAVFLGDTPDTVENQASKLISHVPSGVLLGISQDGREGPGSYGLNRSVAQTVIIAKDGKVLYNFAFTQPMLHPDPYLLGAVGEAIGVKPATLEKWLNEKNPVIEIKNSTEKEKMGKMFLNGNVVQFDELASLLLNLPEEQKSMLTIQSGRDVPHEQIVKVMDMAKKAGIDQIGFAIDSTEDDRMQRAFVGQLQEMIEKGEITGEEARELYEKAFPRRKED